MALSLRAPTNVGCMWFLVARSSRGPDGSGSGVLGQRYGDLIFKDGFEW